MSDRSSTDRSSIDGSALLSAIRGPIMLITLGVLFAMDYSSGVPFRKTWPVLLIVAGVLHLFGLSANRRAPIGGSISGTNTQ